MANIYPIFKKELNNAPEAYSEKQAYAAINQFLPNEYIAFHSIDWSGKVAIHGSQDFECDFIVFHPTKGILVIEVKGGQISYNGDDDTWYSSNRNGKFRIKHPIKQVVKNKHALKQFIKSKFEEKFQTNTQMKMAHAVWFIDVDNCEGDYVRANRDIVLDKSSISNLENAISKAYSYFDDENNNKKVPKENYQKIMKLLLPTGKMNQSIVRNLEYGETQIFDLTTNQVKLLNHMRNHKKVFLNGGAGTGKTLIGFEKAKKEADEGKKVLFTCYSRPLAEALAKNNQIENVKVMKAVRQHGVPSTITADKSGANAAGLKELNRQINRRIKLRQNKYLNNIVEQSHRLIRRMTRPMIGFQNFWSARTTISGIEMVNMIYRGQLKNNGESFVKQFSNLAA